MLVQECVVYPQSWSFKVVYLIKVSTLFSLKAWEYKNLGQNIKGKSIFFFSFYSFDSITIQFYKFDLELE